jgi:aryl-alcohol dehydrogenase-like predicted oxidoreductase
LNFGFFALLYKFGGLCFQMTFGEQNTEKEAHEILSYAIERGINALDTAEAVSSFFLTFIK